MSYQAVLGISLECYVSVVLSISLCRLLELKTTNTSQNCILNELTTESILNGNGGDLYDIFCGSLDRNVTAAALIPCGVTYYGTDCTASEEISKLLPLILASTFPQKTN
jgi:hypothetical protein